MKRRRVLRAAGIAAGLSIVFTWIAAPVPNPPFPDSYSTAVLDAEGRLLKAFLAPDEQWRLRFEGEDLSSKLTASVLTFEDKRFYMHPGVDPVAVVRAAIQSLRAGKAKSGASTITMQVTRLMRPKKRTLANKLLEMVQALKLEARYSKEEILKMYLTHAPYGGNVVGAYAASFYYFGRHPSRLTWAEAATLAVLPKAPAAITPFRNQNTLLSRRNRLLERLYRRGRFDKATLEQALREPLPAQTFPMPKSAPHLCRRAAREHRLPVVRTTLVREIQEQIEFLATRHSRMLVREGIHNASVLVAETSTGAVRAYVGSADFFDAEHSGQVDGVMAPRSTGSLLKPFLYGLLIDRGMLHPDTFVRDVPAYFGSYAPINADRTFQGMVTAREALIRSLNVPPSLLLRDYGVVEFWHFLKQAGMSTLFRQPHDYGLTLILGGAEGTLWDMAALYRGLALGGRFDGLTIIEGKDAPEGRFLLSQASAWMALEMLTELRRPDDDGVDWTRFPARKPVAWKTGTSFGKKDAWAIGITPEWVVAVWIGNFSGEGNPNLGGARSAAPLLFDIIHALPQDPNGTWFDEPWQDFRYAELCADTGFRFSAACPNRKDAKVPRNSGPLPQCPFHQTFFLDDSGQYEVCSLCWREREEVKHEPRLVFPPDVSQFMRLNGHLIDSHPSHYPSCPGLASRNPVKIVYPTSGAHLFVPRDVDGEYERVTLRAAHSAKDAPLFWYLDGRFQGETLREHTRALLLSEGAHNAQVVDQRGHASQVVFHVSRR